MKGSKLVMMLVVVLTLSAMFTVFAFADELTGPDLKIVSFSSEHKSDTGDDDYRSSLAVDGDKNTFWNNEYSPLAGPPHYMVFDLGAAYKITGFRYLPRQDGYAGEENGNLGPYQVLVSLDNATFTEVAGGTFDGTLSTESSATFSAVDGRYFKLVKPTGDYIDLAEITIVTEAAAAAEAPVTTANPATGDHGVLLRILLGVLLLVSIVLLSRKRFARQ
jgi:LPXTG-motif cell wall-anchored protein